MSLKSLVNKSIIKSDIRRYWYLGVAFMFGILLLVAIPAIDNSTREYASDFRYIADLGLVGILPYGIVMPSILFSYLHKKSAVSATHALPLKRESIFVSHVISGVILTVIPLVVNALIMLSVDKIYSPDILKWFGVSLVYCILFSGMSIFASAVAGNVFASVAIPVILILLPIGTAAIFEGIADQYLYGFSHYGNLSLTNVIGNWYFDYESLAGLNMLWYIGIGAVFAVIGFFCYKKRALENNSSVTAFRVLNPVFMYGVAVYGGLLGAFYIVAVADIFSLWLAIPFGILGITVARMLITKTFKPRGIIKPSIVLVAIIAVLYTIFGLDITGYEKRIPDISEIASVNVSGRRDDYDKYTYHNGTRYYVAPEAIEKTDLTEKEDIEKVLALHRSVVAKPFRADYDQTHFSVYYKLKDGRVLVREYWYTPTSEQKEMKYAIDDTPTMKAYKFPIISGRECTYTFGHVYKNGGESIKLTDEQMKAVIETLKLDVAASSAKDRLGIPDTFVELVCDLPLIDDKNERTTATTYTENETYYVHASYTNTIKLLESWR